MSIQANASLQAENARLLQVVHDPRIRGLESIAVTLALTEPDLSAERVIEIVFAVATALGFDPSVDLSRAVDGGVP